MTVRFETEPGRQLQSDWGEIRTMVGGIEAEVHFCVNTLGYSRRFHFWCTDREDAEHTYEGLIRSFEWFGGVSAEVLVDNQKCAVLEHRADGPRFNARFLDLAGHYGFTPRACKPFAPWPVGADAEQRGDRRPSPPPRHGVPPPPASSYQLPRTPPRASLPPPLPRASEERIVAAGFGSLDLRIQPLDAAVTIDGQPWVTSEEGHFVIQVRWRAPRGGLQAGLSAVRDGGQRERRGDHSAERELVFRKAVME